MKYLVVDDSKMARKMMMKSLRNMVKEDDVIVEACNGEEALAQYKTIQPKICFMDLTMPVMDGFEAVKQICEYDSEAKVIIVSADIQEASKQRAKENGAIGFIKKPISEENLSTMLNQLGFI